MVRIFWCKSGFSSVLAISSFIFPQSTAVASGDTGAVLGSSKQPLRAARVVNAVIARFFDRFIKGFNLQAFYYVLILRFVNSMIVGYLYF